MLKPFSRKKNTARHFPLYGYFFLRHELPSVEIKKQSVKLIIHQQNKPKPIMLIDVSLNLGEHNFISHL